MPNELQCSMPDRHSASPITLIERCIASYYVAFDGKSVCEKVRQISPNFIFRIDFLERFDYRLAGRLFFTILGILHVILFLSLSKIKLANDSG